MNLTDKPILFIALGFFWQLYMHWRGEMDFRAAVPSGQKGSLRKRATSGLCTILSFRWNKSKVTTNLHSFFLPAPSHVVWQEETVCSTTQQQRTMTTCSLFWRKNRLSSSKFVSEKRLLWEDELGLTVKNEATWLFLTPSSLWIPSLKYWAPLARNITTWCCHSL